MPDAHISGGDKLDAYLKTLSSKVTNAAQLDVGFFEDAEYPDGTSVAMIAAIQEFGAPKKGIPPRPFFRTMVAAKADEWGPMLGALLDHNDGDAKQSLGQLGEEIKADLKQSIVDTNSPANSPVTDLLKQRFPMGGQTFKDVMKARHDVANGVTAPPGKPLVQTGQMLNSVEERVT